MTSSIFSKIKDPLDVVVYSFDFTSFEGSITTFEIKSISDELTVLDTSREAKILSALVGGGLARKVYVLDATVEFADGTRINRSARIRVEDL